MRTHSESLLHTHCYTSYASRDCHDALNLQTALDTRHYPHCIVFTVEAQRAVAQDSASVQVSACKHPTSAKQRACARLLSCWAVDAQHGRRISYHLEQSVGVRTAHVVMSELGEWDLNQRCSLQHSFGGGNVTD